MNFRNDQFRSFLQFHFLQFVDMYETGFQVSGSFSLNTTDPVPYGHAADYDILHGCSQDHARSVSSPVSLPNRSRGLATSCRSDLKYKNLRNLLTVQRKNGLRVGLLGVAFLRWLVLV